MVTNMRPLLRPGAVPVARTARHSVSDVPRSALAGGLFALRQENSSRISNDGSSSSIDALWGTSSSSAVQQHQLLQPASNMQTVNVASASMVSASHVFYCVV